MVRILMCCFGAPPDRPRAQIIPEDEEHASDNIKDSPIEQNAAENNSLALKDTSHKEEKKSIRTCYLGLPPPPTCDPALDGDPMSFPRPLTEERRVDRLRKIDAFRRRPDDADRFDHICQLLKNVFHVQLAAITLVDEDCIRCRSLTLAPPDSVVLPRKQYPCSWSLLEEGNEVLVIEDMSKDTRTCKANMFMDLYNHDNGVKFYAGAPLTTHDGIRLGALCILHNEPRMIHKEECMMLANLAEMVVRELERDLLLERRAAALEEAVKDHSRLFRAVQSLDEAMAVCRMDLEGWPIVLVNQALTGFIGKRRAEVEGNCFWSVFAPLGPTPGPQAYAQAVQDRVTFAATVVLQGTTTVFEVRLRPMEEDYDASAAIIGVSEATAPQRDYVKDPYYFVTLVPARSSGRGGPGSKGSAATNATVSPAAIDLGSLTPGSHAAPGVALAPVGAPGGAELFSDVRLGRLLGRGGFGKVWKGTWDGAPVAVKVIEHRKDALALSGASGLHSAASYNSGTGKPLRDIPISPVLEAILSTKLSHPHLVHAYKYASRPQPPQPGQEAADPEDPSTLWETWVLQEYCDRGTLQESLVKSPSSLKPAEGVQGIEAYGGVIRVLRGVAAGMAHLHQAGVLHGDLTANNVLLSSGGRSGGMHGHGHGASLVAKVGDFGLARVLEGKHEILTQTFGTVTHMAPEVLVKGSMTAKADVYSFGVIVWQCLSLSRAWEGLTPAQIISAVVSGKQLPPPPPTSPQPLLDLMERCLRAEPDARPSMQMALDALIEMSADL